MKLTFFGHACFLLEINGSKLLFDPFISSNKLASHIDINKIQADYLLISHGHEDHVADAYNIWEKTQAMLISNFEIVTWYQKKGVTKVHPMNIGGQVKFQFGTIKYVNAIHSSVLPDGTYGGNSGGFLITSKNKTIYYAGDTALHYDMKLLAEQYKVDYAILPIGDNFTMGIEDAIIASKYINCFNVIGMHFDTFEYIKINHQEALVKFSDAGVNLSLLNIGQTIDL